MTPKNKIKFFPAALRTALFLLLFFSLFLADRAAESAASSTLRGRALWTDGHGYVYFNCLDDQIGDLLDVEGNLNSTSSLPSGFHFYAEPCTSLVHGVTIGLNNNFSGEALSTYNGLISFAATGTTPNESFRAEHCPLCSVGTCSACYETSSQRVYGYARVIGNGTWISLDQSTTTPTTSPLKIQNYNFDGSNQLFSDILAGEFAYDAISQFLGTTTNSFLSFNCETENGAGNCNSDNNNYKVYISNLQVGKMSAPNWNYTQACGGSALKTVLKWDLKSGQYATGSPLTYHTNQFAFEAVLNDSNSMVTSTSICYSGVISSEAQQYIFDEINCPELDYNKHYWWWLRLYNENNQPTEWYQFGESNNGVVSVITDNDDGDNAPLNFLTYKHEFPSPFFTWTPDPVLVGTSTFFTSESSYYQTDNPTSPLPCNDFQCRYLWSMNPQPGGNTISTTTNETTTMVFGYPTGTAVWLYVTDTDDYVCSTNTVLNVNYGLPIWHEIKAQ